MGSGASTSPQMGGLTTEGIVDCERTVLSKAEALMERPLLFAKVKKMLDQQAQEGDSQARKPYVILAPSGGGKSTFIAQLVSKLRNERESAHGGSGQHHDIIHSVFVGTAANSRSLYHVLTELCRQLVRDIINSDSDVDVPSTIPDDLLGLSAYLEQLLEILVSRVGKKVLLVVDAVNELEGEQARSLFWIPTRPPPNVTILLTTILPVHLDYSAVGKRASDSPAVSQVFTALERRFNITVPGLNHDINSLDTKANQHLSSSTSFESVTAKKHAPNAATGAGAASTSAVSFDFYVAPLPNRRSTLSNSSSSLFQGQGEVESVTILDQLSYLEQVDLLDLLVKGREKWVSGELSQALRVKTDSCNPLYLKLMASCYRYHPCQILNWAEFPATIGDRFDQILDELETLLPSIGEALTAVFVSSESLFSFQLAEILQRGGSPTKSLEALPNGGLRSENKAVVPLMEVLVRSVAAAVKPDSSSPSSSAQPPPPLHCVGFVHMQARDAVQRRWLRHNKQIVEAHLRCATYFQETYQSMCLTTLSTNTTSSSPFTTTRDSLLWNQTLTLLPTHAIGTEDTKFVRQLLCSVDFCSRKCHAGLVSDLCNDFSVAAESFLKDRSEYRDWLECLRQNAHVLREYPSVLLQQALNDRDDSSICRSAAAAVKEATSLPLSALLSSEQQQQQRRFKWRNKPHTRPVCLATIPGHVSALHWTVSASPSSSSRTSNKEEDDDDDDDVGLLAVGSSDGQVRILNRSDGAEVAAMSGKHKGDVVAVRFHPRDPGLVLSVGGAGGESELILHSLDTCETLSSVLTPGFVCSVEWSRDGSKVVVVKPESVMVFNATPEKLHEDRVVWTPSPTISPPAADIEKVGDNKSDSDEADDEEDEEERSKCCVFSPTGDKVVVGAGKRLFIVSLSSTLGEEAEVGVALSPAAQGEGVHRERINAVDWVDGYIASCGNDSLVCLWTEEGTLLRTIRCHRDVVCSVKLARTDKSDGGTELTILSCSEDRTACITTLSRSSDDDAGGDSSPEGWSLPSSTPLRGHGAGVKEGVFVFSTNQEDRFGEGKGRKASASIRALPESRHAKPSVAVTASDDGSIRVWNLAELKVSNAAKTAVHGVNAPISATMWASGQDDGVEDIILVADSNGGLNAFGNSKALKGAGASSLSDDAAKTLSLLLWSQTLESGLKSYAAITALAVSPLGGIGAAAMYRRVHVFATCSGTISLTLNLSDWVNMVVMGPSWGDGNTSGGGTNISLVAAGDSASISVWPSISGKAQEDTTTTTKAAAPSLRMLPPPPPPVVLTHLKNASGGCDSVLSLSLEPTSGSFLASGANDNFVRLWALPEIESSAAHERDTKPGSVLSSPAKQATCADVGDWVIALAFAQKRVDSSGGRSGGEHSQDSEEFLLAAGTAGSDGGIILLRCSSVTTSSTSVTTMSVLSKVRVGCSIAWCGWCGGDVVDKDNKGIYTLVTTSQDKLVQLWRCSTSRQSGQAEAASALAESEGTDLSSGKETNIEMCGVFPALARFGSPDGVGGQGGCQQRVNGTDSCVTCVGDESGRLYLLSTESS